MIIGFKVSSKPADKKHPFGHGQAEIISSVIIGTLLAIVGINFLISSIQKFINHQSAVYGNLAIIVFLISVIAKEGLAQSQKYGDNIELTFHIRLPADMRLEDAHKITE